MAFHGVFTTETWSVTLWKHFQLYSQTGPIKWLIGLSFQGTHATCLQFVDISLPQNAASCMVRQDCSAKLSHPGWPTSHVDSRQRGGTCTHLDPLISGGPHDTTADSEISSLSPVFCNLHPQQSQRNQEIEYERSPSFQSLKLCLLESGAELRSWQQFQCQELIFFSEWEYR